MESCEVDPVLGNQCRQTDNEVHRLQSGIRLVQWRDGTNHEGLATLLRADGDALRSTYTIMGERNILVLTSGRVTE